VTTAASAGGAVGVGVCGGGSTELLEQAASQHSETKNDIGIGVRAG